MPERPAWRQTRAKALVVESDRHGSEPSMLWVKTNAFSRHSAPQTSSRSSATLPVLAQRRDGRGVEGYGSRGVGLGGLLDEARGTHHQPAADHNGGVFERD